MAAGKGGLGTSTAAALLASALSAQGRKVLLVDGSDHFGTLEVLLGATRAASLEDLKGGGAEPQDLLVPVADGLTLVPGSLPNGAASLSPTERRLLFGRVTSLFGEYELVLFDAGASAASVLDACANGATRVLAVTAGDRITVTATFALIKLLHQRCPHVRVDLLGNRIADDVASRIHDALNAATLQFLGKTVQLVGVVPHDPDFESALAAGLGAHEAAAGSHAAPVMAAIGTVLFEPPATPRGVPGVIPFPRHAHRDAH